LFCYSTLGSGVIKKRRRSTDFQHPNQAPKRRLAGTTWRRRERRAGGGFVCRKLLDYYL